MLAIAPRSKADFHRDPVLDRDNALWDAATDALRLSGHRVLATIHCEVRDGVAFLTGKLPSFYLKQVAQAVILGQTAVEGVTNMVEVSRR